MKHIQENKTRAEILAGIETCLTANGENPKRRKENDVDAEEEDVEEEAELGCRLCQDRIGS